MKSKENLNKIKELNSVGLTAESSLFEAVEKDLSMLDELLNYIALVRYNYENHYIIFKKYPKVMMPISREVYDLLFPRCMIYYYERKLPEKYETLGDETLGESIEIVKNVDKTDLNNICPTNSSCDDCGWSEPCMRHPSN